MKEPLHASKHPQYLRDEQAASILDPTIDRLLSLILKHYVASWYSQFTSDKSFFDRVTLIIKHVIREVERRLQNAHLERLLLLELPYLIQRHYDDFQIASERATSDDYAKVAQIYCHLNPHPAFAPDEQTAKVPYVSTVYLSSLVDSILQHILPEEDYAADSERHVIRDIVIYVVLSNLFSKLAQPWFLHTLVIKFLSADSVPPNVGKKSTWTEVWQHLLALWRLEASLEFPEHIVSTWIEVVATIFEANKHPIIKQSCYLLEILAWPFHALTNRLIANGLRNQLTNYNHVKHALLMATTVLFPNDLPATAVPDPSSEEQAMFQETAYNLIEAHIQHRVRSQFPTSWVSSRLMDPFSQSSCNARLILSILELVVAHLFPELTAI